MQKNNETFQYEPIEPSHRLLHGHLLLNIFMLKNCNIRFTAPTFVPNTDHVCQSDVKEHSTRQGEDPVRGETVAGQDAKTHAEVAAASRQEVKEESLLYAHASVQQDHKVSWLVGKDGIVNESHRKQTDQLTSPVAAGSL